MFTKMVLLSIRRRKKEIRFVSIVTFIIVVFLTGVSVFQNVMNRYLIETNYKNYGEWILASLDKELSHPYFSATGSCKTGASVQNRKGEDIHERIGSVDEGFLTFANLEFYEGGLPKEKHEIVMNLTTLAKLGYSMELGQNIPIRIQNDTKIVEKEFVLVGIIKDFSNTWRYVEGYPLASCLVTGEALAELGGSSYTTHFYQLERRYEGIDVQEFKQAFLTSEKIVWNDYVYDNTIWGAQEMFADMQRLLIFIAVLVLGYLMISYVIKRRSWYEKLRGMGAEWYQIWGAVFVEGIFGTVPWAILGVVVSYVIAAFLCEMVSIREDLPSIFVVDGKALFGLIVTIAGILLSTLCMSCIGTTERYQSGFKTALTEGQFKRLKRAVQGNGNIAKQFLERERIARPWQNVVKNLSTCVVSAVLVICVLAILWKQEEFQITVGNQHDFTAKKYKTEESGQETFCFDYGMNEQLKKELEAIEGISQIEAYIVEKDSVLEWGTGNQYFSYLLRADTFSDLRKEYALLLEHTRFTAADFIKGEQIIVVYPESVELPSDTMEVIWKNKNLDVEIPVTACVPSLTEKQRKSLGLDADGSYIFAETGFAERITQMLGTSVENNVLEIEFTSNTSYESTNKRLASALVNYGFSYEVGWEGKEMARKEFYNVLCIYGTLFGMVAISYLVLQMNIQQMHHYNCAERYKQLKRLGMSNDYFLWLNIKSGMKDAVWLFSGVMVACGLHIYVKGANFWLDESWIEDIAVVFGVLLLVMLLSMSILAYIAQHSMIKGAKEV